MIEFHETEDEQLLVETAKRFADEHLLPLEREHEAARAFPASLVSMYEELGFAHLGLPEELGGIPVPMGIRIGVWAALAAGDPAAPMAMSPWALASSLAETPAGAALLESGEPGLITWGGELQLDGDRVFGLIPWAPQPRATWLVAVGKGWVRRIHVSSDSLAQRPCGLQAAGGLSMTLDGAASEPMGNGELAAKMHSEMRLFAAAVALGAGRYSYEYSKNYAQERVVFGKPVAHHQAIAFQIADCASMLDGAALLLGAAASRPDRHMEVANAYLEVMSTVEHVADRGVQLLGGHGYLYDHPVEKRMRDIRALACLYGGPAAARADAAVLILDAPEPLEVCHD